MLDCLACCFRLKLYFSYCIQATFFANFNSRTTLIVKKWLCLLCHLLECSFCLQTKDSKIAAMSMYCGQLSTDVVGGGKTNHITSRKGLSGHHSRRDANFYYGGKMEMRMIYLLSAHSKAVGSYPPTGLSPLCCWGPTHSNDSCSTALEAVEGIHIKNTENPLSD